MVVAGAEGTGGFRVNCQEAIIKIQEENGENLEESESCRNGEKYKDPKDLGVETERTGEGLGGEAWSEGK